MKVFVFCVAILLAATVKASPLNVDGEILNNELDAEVQVDPEPEVYASPEGEEETEGESIGEEFVQENEIESEDSEQEAVPYDDDSGKAFQGEEEEEPEMTEEEKERTYGIVIPMCTTYFNNRVPLHLSHLTECGKFYKCYNGVGYLMDCPAGEHWSVNLDRCDYPFISKCKVDGSYQFKVKKTKPIQASEQVDEEEDKPETEDFEVDPRCEGSDPFKPMHYKHVNDCSKFYKCYMGKAYVIKCPKGQQWSQNLNRCEHPSIAKCTIKPAAIKPAQAIEESDSEEEYDYEYFDYGPSISDDPDYKIDDSRCLTEDADIFHPVQFAHPMDCTMFYKCFAKQAYKIQCPGGLHYSVEKEQCDYPESAECTAGVVEAGVMEAQAQETVYSPSIPNCKKNEDTKFAVEGSFTRYFSCMGGLAYLMECQAQEIFNPITKNCENFQMPQYPMMPMMPDFNQQFPGWMQQFPGGMMPQFPEGMTPHFFEGTMPPFPEGLMPQFPQFPGMPMNPMNPMNPPKPIEKPQVPMAPKPIEKPQIPTAPKPAPNQPPKPQAPEISRPEFPSWMPVPNPNVPAPELPNAGKPSHDKPTDKNEFNYQNGKPNSRCPTSDNPTKPQHLSHESDCAKFYKCYNGRAFMMECPSSQEWSDDLQRCDYHQFANCDPVELLKKKIQA